MNILLLNDASMKAVLSRDHHVLAGGMNGAPLVMPDQGDFDFVFPGKPVMPIEAILDRMPRGFVPDCIIHFETHNNFFYVGIECLPVPLLWRTIDNHMHSWQPDYSGLYDITFIAQKDYYPDFVKRSRCHVHWLPLHCFPQVHYDRGLARDLDVAFVGTLDPVLKPNRVEFLRKIGEKIPVTVFEHLDQQQLSVTYNRSKIVLNECMNNDVNYRIFETLANGALCLTPEIGNGLPDLFENGTHLVTYTPYDPDDVATQCRIILSNWDCYRDICRNGRRLVLEKHTLASRAREMMQVLQSYGFPMAKTRPQRLTASVYEKLLPLFIALFNRKHAGFFCIDYLLTAIKGFDKERALHRASVYQQYFKTQGIYDSEQAFSRWVANNK